MGSSATWSSNESSEEFTETDDEAIIEKLEKLQQQQPPTPPTPQPQQPEAKENNVHTVRSNFFRWAIVNIETGDIFKKFNTAPDVAKYLKCPTQKVYDYSVGRVKITLSDANMKLVRLKSKHRNQSIQTIYY